jgi:hypothetical protein
MPAASHHTFYILNQSHWFFTQQQTVGFRGRGRFIDITQIIWSITLIHCSTLFVNHSWRLCVYRNLLRTLMSPEYFNHFSHFTLFIHSFSTRLCMPSTASFSHFQKDQRFPSREIKLKYSRVGNWPLQLIKQSISKSSVLHTSDTSLPECKHSIETLRNMNIK